MIWIATYEKDTDKAALEKRLWDAAEQAVPSAHDAESEYHSARPEGLLGLKFLRFAEVRSIAQRAKRNAEDKVAGGDQSPLHP